MHPTVEADPETLAKFNRRYCSVCAGHARTARVLEERDDLARKKWGDDPPADRVDPADGQHQTVQLARAEPPTE